MSLSTCTVPGAPREDRVPMGMAELGWGIHGEAGVEQIAFSDAKAAVAAMAGRLSAKMEDKQHVALINNLGGTSPLEMTIVLNEVRQSAISERISHVVGPATMMTSLDMHGVSTSIFPADDAEIALLRQHTPVAAWPGLSRLGEGAVQVLHDGLAAVAMMPSSHEPTPELSHPLL